MASIIQSANRSTVSLFDTVTHLTEAAGQLVSVSARAVDMLDVKAKAMHQSVVQNSLITLAMSQEETIEEHAIELTERKEQRHRRMFPDKEFDRASCYQSIVAKLRATLGEPEQPNGSPLEIKLAKV